VSATGVAADAAGRSRSTSLGVLVVGCGLIGERRARAAAAHPHSQLRAVMDRDSAAARRVAGERCMIASDWREAVSSADVDVVVVATSNDALAEIAIAALSAGKHVLMEKPMGRNLVEARAIAAAAMASGCVLRVGFNHRHHPAIRRAAELVRSGALGRLVTLRARYGHGGRPGLEHEWRSDPRQAGGGELIDQGVHLADLFHWLAGMPTDAFAVTQTAVWPIQPLEDNAYGVLRFASGAVAQLHVSMTQWRNLFSLEVHGEAGAVIVDGLGGSYGVERLTRVFRAFEGGRPVVEEEHFDGGDRSWAEEWDAFMAAVETGSPGDAGPEDGVAAMSIIDALYRSARAGERVLL
jgi:predicted dehydrogenase